MGQMYHCMGYRITHHIWHAAPGMQTVFLRKVIEIAAASSCDHCVFPKPRHRVVFATSALPSALVAPLDGGSDYGRLHRDRGDPWDDDAFGQCQAAET